MKLANIICSIILAASVIAFAGFSMHQKASADTEGPVIEMDNAEIEISIEDDVTSVLKGVTATDATDGDVTDTLVIESISGFDDEMKRTVSLAAFDNNNHVTKATRTVTYSDYTHIRYALRGSLKFPYLQGEVNILGRVYAKDCIDGDISRKIMIAEGSVVDTDTVGEYEIVLSVANSAGDTEELPVVVTIYDNSNQQYTPTIILSKYLVYTKQGKALNPADYIAGVDYRGAQYQVTDGEGTFAVDTSEMTAEQKEELNNQTPSVSKSLFKITDNVDYNKAGSYIIKYEIEDSEGFRDSVLLTVVVEGA